MRKKIAIAFVCLVVAIALVFSLGYLYCDYLGEGDIDAFVVMKSIVKLNLGKENSVILADEPLRFLTGRENTKKFVEEYFDSLDGEFYYQGFGQKDGVRYKYMVGTFSRWYETVTLTKI